MTLTLSTREFYGVYDKEGDNIVEEGKVLGLSQRSLVWQLPPLSIGEVHSNFRLTEFRMSASTRFYCTEY